jgi:chitinase
VSGIAAGVIARDCRLEDDLPAAKIGGHFPGTLTMHAGTIHRQQPARWRIPAMLLVCLALTGCDTAMPRSPAIASPYRVIGYDKAMGGDIRPSDVNRIDTLIFAFARVANGDVVLDPPAQQRLARLVALKQEHPRLKVVVSVGGWKAGGFSEAASTPEGRRKFAESAAALVVANHADGLDVDWEYPGHHESGIVSSPQDREHFTLLLQELRRVLDRAGDRNDHRGADHYSLSIAAADGDFVSGIDLAAVATSLDWINMMTYDFVNSMTPYTGNHSGLYSSDLAPADARSTDKAVRQFLAAGVPPRKLMIGAAFYGREFADVSPAHNGLYQSYGHYQGEHSWPQLKADFIDRNGFVRHWDAKAQAPYLWNPATRDFISYDDAQSIAAKARYVKSRHLGGIMYWEQGEDPQGELLDAIWRGLQ